MLNRGGTVLVAQVPQSIPLEYTSATAISAASFTALWNLVADNPDAKVFNGASLGANHTIVASPSSFMKYNTYESWVPVSTPPTSDAGGLIAQPDWVKLIGSGPGYVSSGILPTFPYTANHGAQGETPTNYMTLVAFDNVSAAQSYEIEVFCQDAVRYPASSMAYSVKHTPGDPARTMTDAQASATASAAAREPIHPSSTLEDASNAVATAVESGVGALIGPRVYNALSRTWSTARGASAMAAEDAGIALAEIIPALGAAI